MPVKPKRRPRNGKKKLADAATVVKAVQVAASAALTAYKVAKPHLRKLIAKKGK